MSEENWFWEEEGERKGPESAEHVKGLREAGTISDSSLVWRDGMEDWTPFAESQLAGTAGPPPVPARKTPPIPVQTTRPQMPTRQARLRHDYRPAFRSSLKRAWDLMVSDFWPFVGFGALVYVILSVAMQFYLPMLFLVYPIIGGYGYYILKRIRGYRADIDDVFAGFKTDFKELALLNLILSIPTAILLLIFTIGIFAFFMAMEALQGPDEGYILLAVGFTVLGLILSLGYFFIHLVGCFAYLLIMDCGLGWRESLRLGWSAVKPHWFKLLIMATLVSVLANLGVIALGVGVFVTMAWGWIAMVFWYEDAFGDDRKVAANE